MLQQVRVRANRGSLHLEQGYYEEAIAELDLGLRLADMAGFVSYRALALSNRGALITISAAWKKRSATSTKRGGSPKGSTRMTSPIPSPTSAASIATGATWRWRERLSRKRLARCESSQDVQGLVPALSGLALTLATDDPDRPQIRFSCPRLRPGYGLREALLAAGWVALANDQPGERYSCASEAAAEARSRTDRAGLAQSLELRAAAGPASPGAIGTIEQAIALWSELGSATGSARADFLAALILKDRARAEAAASLLRQLGIRSHHSLERLLAKAQQGSRTPVGLSDSTSAGMSVSTGHSLFVQTLGRFRVLVDGDPVAASSWQSRKARDLLKVLVARRGRSVPRGAHGAALARRSRRKGRQSPIRGAQHPAGLRSPPPKAPQTSTSSFPTENPAG